MTDIEMKEDKPTLNTEEKKVEDQQEPSDHFYGKRLSAKILYVRRTQKDTCFA